VDKVILGQEILALLPFFPFNFHSTNALQLSTTVPAATTVS